MRLGVSEQPRFATVTMVTGMPLFPGSQLLYSMPTAMFCLQPRGSIELRHTLASASKSAFQNPVFQRSPVMCVSLTQTHLPTSTWTFTPLLPPKGVGDWSCTFSVNGIRPSCATKGSRRHRSTAKFAGFLSVVFMAVPPVTTARFTIYYHCPTLNTPREREWKTLPFFAPTAIA